MRSSIFLSLLALAVATIRPVDAPVVRRSTSYTNTTADSLLVTFAPTRPTSVRLGPSPPSPPPSGPVWAGEPAGMTVRNDYGWSDPLTFNERPIGRSGWACNQAGARRADDPTAPTSPTSVMQMDYPAGYRGGVGPTNCWLTLSAANTKEIYVGITFKISNPWQGHPSGVNKFGFITTGGTQAALIPEFFGQAAPYRLRYAIFELGVEQNPAYNGWLEPNVGNGTVTLGVWHQLGTYANYNGTVKVWLDGVLVMSYSDIKFRHAGFDGWKINPTWGGLGGTKTETDWIRIDHVHTSTR